MTIRFSRLLALASIAFLLPASIGIAPAQAASDSAMLQSYAGNYTGSGKLSGNPPQSVRCRLSLQPSGPSKVNYTGRCSAAGASFSMTGVISTDHGRFQAAMSGSSGMSGSATTGVVTGKRSGGGVVFSSTQNVTVQGRSRAVSSTLALTGGTIRVDFSMLDSQTGKQTAGSIPFTKL